MPPLVAPVRRNPVRDPSRLGSCRFQDGPPILHVVCFVTAPAFSGRVGDLGCKGATYTVAATLPGLGRTRIDVEEQEVVLEGKSASWWWSIGWRIRRLWRHVLMYGGEAVGGVSNLADILEGESAG
jgi:hypothetical protein